MVFCRDATGGENVPLFGEVFAMMAWFITCLVLSFVVRGSAILGNSAFEAVRNVSAAFSERHDELFQKFSNCSVKRVAPQKVYLTQDGSGGGGIGNLILKIK